MLWLLVFVPAVLAAERLAEGSQTLLSVLSVLAIVPLAALLSHATESVAAKTGDAVGRLTGRAPAIVGIAMVVLGSVMVGLTIALGG